MVLDKQPTCKPAVTTRAITRQLASPFRRFLLEQPKFLDETLAIKRQRRGNCWAQGRQRDTGDSAEERGEHEEGMARLQNKAGNARHDTSRQRFGSSHTWSTAQPRSSKVFFIWQAYLVKVKLEEAIRVGVV